MSGGFHKHEAGRAGLDYGRRVEYIIKEGVVGGSSGMDGMTICSGREFERKQELISACRVYGNGKGKKQSKLLVSEPGSS